MVNDSEMAWESHKVVKRRASTQGGPEALYQRSDRMLQAKMGSGVESSMR